MPNFTAIFISMPSSGLEKAGAAKPAEAKDG